MKQFSMALLGLVLMAFTVGATEELDRKPKPKPKPRQKILQVNAGGASVQVENRGLLGRRQRITVGGTAAFVAPAPVVVQRQRFFGPRVQQINVGQQTQGYYYQQPQQIRIQREVIQQQQYVQPQQIQIQRERIYQQQQYVQPQQIQIQRERIYQQQEQACPQPQAYMYQPQVQQVQVRRQYIQREVAQPQCNCQPQAQQEQIQSQCGAVSQFRSGY